MCSWRHFIFSNMCFSFFSVCSSYHIQHILGIESFSFCIYRNVLYNDPVVFSSVGISKPRHGASVELQQSLWKISTKFYGRCCLNQQFIWHRKSFFPFNTANSWFQGRQRRNSIHNPSLPSHLPPARCLLGDTAAVSSELSLATKLTRQACWSDFYLLPYFPAEMPNASYPCTQYD